MVEKGKSGKFNLVSTISLEDRRTVSKELVPVEIPKGTT